MSLVLGVALEVFWPGPPLNAAQPAHLRIIDPTLIEKAAYIFVGTVKQVEPMPFQCGKAIVWQRVHYEVHDLLKGTLAAQDQKDFIIGYRCGVTESIQSGRQLLVFAHREEPISNMVVWENLLTTEATPEPLRGLRAALAAAPNNSPTSADRSMSFVKLIRCADLVVISRATDVRSDAQNGTATATLELEEIIKGDPISHTILVPFFLPQGTERPLATFLIGQRYLTFLLDVHPGTIANGPIYPEYSVVDVAVGGDVGQGVLDSDRIRARVMPPGASGSMPVAEYVQAIREILANSQPDISKRVEQFLIHLRQGSAVWGLKQDLIVGFPRGGDVIEPVDDIRDLLHDAVVPLLALHLHDEDVRVRRGICQLLKHIGTRAAASLLWEGLQDDDRIVRTACIEGLVKARDWASVPTLIQMLDDRVTDQQTDNLNEQIKQALWAIIAQHRYRQQWRKETLYRVENDTILSLPHCFSACDSPEAKRAIIQQWRDWLAQEQVQFSQ